MPKSLGDVKPIEILIVEDNPGDVYLLRMALEKVSFPLHVTTVEDGEAAIRYFLAEGASAEHPWPDLILLDVNLPKKSGYEVLAALRAHPKASLVPALVVSSSNAEKDIRLAYELGAHRYIQKRVDLEDLDQIAIGVETFCASFASRRARAQTAAQKAESAS
jgi:two-component system response regulator